MPPRRYPRPLSPKSQVLYHNRLKFAFGDDYAMAIRSGAPLLDRALRMTASMRNLTIAALTRFCSDNGVDPLPYLAQFNSVEQYEIKRVKTRFLSEREIEAYSIQARAERLWVREPVRRGRSAMGLLPLIAGLRADELLSLTNASVERAAQTGVLLVTRKGGEEQELEHQKAIPLFVDLLAAYASPGVFRVEGAKYKPRLWRTVGEILSPGERITQYHLYHAMVQFFGSEAGIGRMHPHLLRHAFATRFVRDGGPLPVLQKYLNHKDLRTTQRYLHMTTADAQKYLRGE